MLVIAVPPLAVLVASVAWLAIDDPFLNADTSSLVDGARGVVDCLSEGQFTHCDRRPDGYETGPGPNGFVWARFTHVEAGPLVRSSYHARAAADHTPEATALSAT